MRIIYTSLVGLFLLLMSSCGTSQIGQVVDLDPKEFKAELDKQNGILVDVRTKGEFAEGYIDGAINHDVNAKGFIEELDAVLYALMDSNENKDAPVFVYCKAGGRSSKAAGMLIDKGYKHVYNLSGGITSWQNASLPTK